jgi:hypothetical protein
MCDTEFCYAQVLGLETPFVEEVDLRVSEG